MILLSLRAALAQRPAAARIHPGSLVGGFASYRHRQQEFETSSFFLLLVFRVTRSENARSGLAGFVARDAAVLASYLTLAIIAVASPKVPSSDCG